MSEVEGTVPDMQDPVIDHGPDRTPLYLDFENPRSAIEDRLDAVVNGRNRPMRLEIKPGEGGRDAEDFAKELL
jgi:hypothetical protein